MRGKFCSFALYTRVKEVLSPIVLALFLSAVVCSCKEEEPIDGPCFMPAWNIFIISGDEDFSVDNHFDSESNPKRIQCDVGDRGGIAVIHYPSYHNEVIQGIELIDYAEDIKGKVTGKIDYGRCSVQYIFPNIVHFYFKPKSEGESKNFKIYLWERDQRRRYPIYINYR